ncbi:MAG: hypothetical protein H6656_06855 [Ardenticatenaceae bacterium]|nr:hypothetical protein [Anaerolineales bacterium]MCB9007066.1 hypothetical protein [Ardenticatenaceae bacterium]
MKLKQSIAIFIAVFFGLVTLVALLFNVSGVSNLILGWASFLAAIALILGVLNLLLVHLTRLFKERNFYSGVLVLGMLLVFAAAVLDSMGGSNNVDFLFSWVQAPLEAALASLLAIFLLLAGVQLLKRQRTRWAFLFGLTAVVMLLGQALLASRLLPAALRQPVNQVVEFVQNVVVTAGMRGLLIGVALGTLLLSLRLLMGVERPYNK